jgi:protein Mpv17
MKLVTLFMLTAPLVEGFVGGGSGRTLDHNQPSFVMTPKKSTKLFLSDIPMSEPEEELRERDPIQFLKMQASSLDMNAIINISILLIVSLSVLNAVATVDAGITRGWTAEEMAVRIPIDNWSSYSAVLEKEPLYTKAVTSATVYTIGDIISQKTEGKSVGEFDRARVIRSLLAGLIGHGPMSHVWYDWSEHIFENVMHLQGWTGTVIKVAIDQTTWGPLWNNTYILLLGLMKLDKLENIFGEMKRTTIPLIVSGLKLWPLAHIVTYGLVPVQNRLLWVDLVEIIWVTILSTAASGGENAEEAVVATAEEAKA